MSDKHIPVMLKEVIAWLQPAAGGVYVDATFGRGGYSRAILETGAHVYGIDRDPEALAAGAKLQAAHQGRLHLLPGQFGDMDKLLAAEGISAVDGVALDLGVSSPQLDTPERGFSFRTDGPLDMRMSKTGQSAADAVNTLTEKELADIIFHLGEERHARKVARAICKAREEKPITRTLQLADIVRRSVPHSRDGLDPATRTFQALRIYVNDELGELQRGLQAAERLLKAGGKLVVVSFHSLEDRAVKQFMRARSGSTAVSRHLPTPVNDSKPGLRLLTVKPAAPTEEESHENPRAASAKLRAAEKLADGNKTESETGIIWKDSAPSEIKGECS